jgi:hypothetical protein
LRPLFYQKKTNQSVGQQAIIFSKTYLGYFNMSVSEQQRLFNPYPIKEFVPDIWHGLSKADKRNSTVALTYAYLLDGGLITKAPPKKRKGSRPEIFTKDTRAVKVHEYWSRKFYAGDDFTAKGPRFTSKPIPEKSADKRDIERKAGVSHSEFVGAVVEINGKLQPRNAPHTADEALVDMVSSGGNSEKVVVFFEDAGDDLSDAYRRARIRDDLNLNAVDHAHNAKFKLAA